MNEKWINLWNKVWLGLFLKCPFNHWFTILIQLEQLTISEFCSSCMISVIWINSDCILVVKNIFCYTVCTDIMLPETHLIHFRSDIGLKVVLGNKYWSSEISLINNSYPSEDYRSLQTLDSHPFLPSLWRYSGNRWMEIL